jgi:anti-sigma factor RsiW
MNAPTSLHPTDQTLSSYGLGKLDDILVEAIEKHLEQCPDCRKRVAEMSADSFLGRVRDAQAGAKSPFGMSDRRDAERQGVKRTAPNRQPSTRPGRPRRLRDQA